MSLRFHIQRNNISAYLLWGALLMIPAIIFPPEAEKKGVLPSQVSQKQHVWHYVPLIMFIHFQKSLSQHVILHFEIFNQNSLKE